MDADRSGTSCAALRLAARKGAIVALHWSVGAMSEHYQASRASVRAAVRNESIKCWRMTSISAARPSHPARAAPFRINDEFYYRLDLVPRSAFHPCSDFHRRQRRAIGWAGNGRTAAALFAYVGLLFINWDEWSRAPGDAGVLWTLDLPIPAAGVNADLPQISNRRSRSEPRFQPARRQPRFFGPTNPPDTPDERIPHFPCRAR